MSSPAAALYYFLGLRILWNIAENTPGRFRRLSSVFCVSGAAFMTGVSHILLTGLYGPALNIISVILLGVFWGRVFSVFAGGDFFPEFSTLGAGGALLASEYGVTPGASFLFFGYLSGGYFVAAALFLPVYASLNRKAHPYFRGIPVMLIILGLLTLLLKGWV